MFIIFSCVLDHSALVLSPVWVYVNLKKVCLLSSALKPCEPLAGLKTLPGYTRLTITILFHSNLFLETPPLLTVLAIVHHISHLSIEWILVVLGGIRSRHRFGFPASNSWTPSVSMASLTTSLSLLFSVTL